MAHASRDITHGGVDRRTVLKSSAALGLADATGGGFDSVSAPARSRSQDGTPVVQTQSSQTGSRVKVFLVYAKREDLTEQQFHDYWRHPHSTRGRDIAVNQHFVQSHQIDTPHLGATQKRWDGVGEIWFESLGDAAGLQQDPVYMARLAPDEPNFIDVSSLNFLVVDEEVLMSGPLPQNGADERDLGWREQDRPITIKLIQFFEPAATDWSRDDDLAFGRALGALRHVRGRPNPLAHADGAFAAGVRELWWPTLTALEDGVAAAPEAWARLRDRDPNTALLAHAERWS